MFLTMRILIVTPLIPPEPGGPSYYSVSLKEALERAGHTVDLIAFREVRKYASGVRHIIFFYKVLHRALFADALIVLDTVSVALPAVVAGWTLGKKTIIRTGGDFVWEAYVERTGEKVLFRDFYAKPRALSRKERFLVWVQKRVVLPLASHVAFNTSLQREVWRTAYRLSDTKTSVLPNAQPVRAGTVEGGRVFVCAWRPTAFKNIDTLEIAYKKARGECPSVTLDLLRDIPREELYVRMRSARALVIPSLTEFGPNMALEALSLGVPVLLTRECGDFERLDGHVVWIDPLDPAQIAHTLCALTEDTAYQEAREKAHTFSFARSYSEVAQDFIALLDQ